MEKRTKAVENVKDKVGGKEIKREIEKEHEDLLQPKKIDKKIVSKEEIEPQK
ncbi:MAG: hypothetical protein ISF22_11200 [Methanomassiliicoccus sp.]|nr:hypothetical protein [Methanomassiliicoccus sp.]